MFTETQYQSSILDFIREDLLAHFSYPFWLHIMIGQLTGCSKKRAKADWLMTCAKADWLRTNVVTFFLLSDWLVQNFPLFWFWLWCHLCHLWRQIVSTLATLIEILSTSLWAHFKSFGCFIEKNRKQVFSGHCLGSTFTDCTFTDWLFFEAMIYT